MKVLHAAADIAGQPWALCQGLRAHGVDARSLVLEKHWCARPNDIEIDGSGVSGMVRRIRALLEHAGAYDIVHLHFGTSFLPRMLDVPYLKRRGAKIVFHYHGCDIRPRIETLATHPISACLECPVYCTEPRQARVRRVAENHAALTIVSTPDLLEAAPGAVHLPVALDVDAWSRLRSQVQPEAERFVVLHAPSDPLIKGTRHVDAAVEALSTARGDVEYLKVVGVPAAEAAVMYARATVAVDQLHMGWHGLFAAEAMMLGMPVLSYIRPGLRDYRPGLPVVPTDRNTLLGALERLADDPDERRRLIAAGIAYASHEHDMVRVAGTLKRLYEEHVLDGQVA